jgi:Gram-negative bacterial TonB protein C-terminal
MKAGIIASVVTSAVLLGLAPAVARADQEALASAKTLYEAASYEAALSELSTIDSEEHVDVIETYRALCFLGLGRTREAEQALELVVTRKPLMMLSDTEYSPRVVALFRDVRKRALPVAAQQLYSTARSDFENKNFESAAMGFKQALQVIADVGPTEQTATLADLKQLADGFLALSEGKVAQQSPARGTQALAGSATMANAGSPVYSLADPGVKPPVVTEQRLPAWQFHPSLRERSFRGQLELVIDESGAVESATLADPIWPSYDGVLLQAARKWRYQPAMKDGKPVRFRRVMDINVDPKAVSVR